MTLCCSDNAQNNYRNTAIFLLLLVISTVKSRNKRITKQRQRERERESIRKHKSVFDLSYYNCRTLFFIGIDYRRLLFVL